MDIAMSDQIFFLKLYKNKNTQRVYTSAKSIIISKWENPDYYSLYPDSDPDHSQNFILLTDKQTYKQVMKIIPP